LTRLWTLGGLSLLLLASICYDVAAGVAADGSGSDERLSTQEQDAHKRESRGILLRSWRNIQTRNREQTQPALLMDNSNVYARPWAGRQSDSVPIMLSSLPVAMKIALLQRLTGHDKRTPNSRAFLGQYTLQDTRSLIMQMIQVIQTVSSLKLNFKFLLAAVHQCNNKNHVETLKCIFNERRFILKKPPTSAN
jgi:hypothetical protein